MLFSIRAVGIAAGAVAAALLASGCHDDTPPPTTVVPAASAPAAGPDTKINTNAGPGGSAGTDAALADRINTAIVHNKQMTGSRVEVVATAGVVTLNGTVQNQQQKGLAQTSAQSVSGVGSIKNKLIIVTTGGAKPKPVTVTKTKVIVVHDQAPAPPSDTSAPDTAPAPPNAPAADPSSNPANNPAPDSSGTP